MVVSATESARATGPIAAGAMESNTLWTSRFRSTAIVRARRISRFAKSGSRRLNPTNPYASCG
jgi:hypothetical protein